MQDCLNMTRGEAGSRLQLSPRRTTGCPPLYSELEEALLDLVARKRFQGFDASQGLRSWSGTLG